MLTSAQRRGRGFSLVEVLVAMLVLAIGLLGLAALQTQGVRFNHDALVRTSATNLAADIMDSIRAASGQASDAALQFVTANFPARLPAPPGGVYTTVDPPYNCNPMAPIAPYDSSLPNPGDVVALDMANAALPCWLNAVELTLPLGGATIEQQAANPELFDISLMWLDREPREFGGDTRLPEDKGECEALPSRIWRSHGGTDRCFVIQTWTVQP